MARPYLVTEQITIPEFQQYISTYPRADCILDSPNITNITNDNLLYPGLEISNINFPAETTVVSVNYLNHTAVLSQYSTGNATVTPIEIVFTVGLYYCPLATFIEVNTQYDNDDIVEGFQIVNQTTDLASSSLLIGVFNLWKITYVSYRDPNGSTLSFYVLFDEYSSYLATGARPSVMEVSTTRTRSTASKLGQCALFNLPFSHLTIGLCGGGAFPNQ